MIGLMATIQTTTATWGTTMSKKTTPLTPDAVKRIVKAEVIKHGHVRKGSHAAKVQSILDKRTEG